MATDKRERQRANREEKKAVEAKQERRQKLWARVKKWTIYGVAIVVIYLVLTLLLR
jgi:predicted anti-sigma-YlaC factor YlaD